MPTILITRFKLQFIFLLSCLFSMPSHAYYYVLEDDLLPEADRKTRTTPPVVILPPQGQRGADKPVVPTPWQQTSTVSSTSQYGNRYIIPFLKSRSPLINKGRGALDTLIPYMQGATIHIIGRPDAMVYTQGKIAQLAYNRAHNIQDYLTSQGIPLNSIVVEIDNTPNPQPNGSLYPCDLYISKPKDARTGAAELTLPVPITSDKATGIPEASTNTSEKNSSANGASNEQVIRFINQSVASGLMEPAIALKLMQSLSNEPKISKATFEAAPSLVRKVPWILDKKLTLRDNLDAWSKIAGWNPSVWEASNYYQVNATSSLNGDFPDILRQIADSTGLNICAKKHEKYVRVTDSSVSCK